MEAYNGTVDGEALQFTLLPNNIDFPARQQPSRSRASSNERWEEFFLCFIAQ